MSNRIDTNIARLRDRGWTWPIAWEAVELIGRREDCRLSAYQCLASVWTIGWGETQGVTPDMRWTPDQADARFLQQIRKYAARVEALCTVPPNENQLGAMVSLAYNIGLGGIEKSTVMRRHNGSDFDAAARAFALWNKARVGGVLQEVRGLTLRRAAEAALYLTPVDGAPQERMPQSVEPESETAASPIAKGGAITVAAGAATGLGALTDQFGAASVFLGSLKGIGAEVADFIGLPPKALLAALLIGVGVWVWKWRKKQREGGWA